MASKVQIELGTVHDEGLGRAEQIQLSIAISLKRIADLIEAHERRVVEFYATKSNPEF